MLEFFEHSPPLQLCLRAQSMGADFCIQLSGGEPFGAHVGAVALAVPRPSNTGNQSHSATASVLTVPGHEEDLLARRLALQAARHLGVKVVMVCGIHADHASLTTIATMEAMAQSLMERLLHTLDASNIKDQPC